MGKFKSCIAMQKGGVSPKNDTMDDPTGHSIPSYVYSSPGLAI